MSISSDIQKLNAGSIMELFELDLTSLGDGILRFHPGKNELVSNVTWQGNAYAAFPIQADGFELSGSGRMPRPTVRVANVTGLVSAALRDFNDLVGAKVTRKRTLVKYLDAVNFTGSINPTADPSQEFSDEVWFIDRKSAESKSMVEFELSAAWDVQGIALPRRQVVANSCPWKYRSAECSYTGGPVADITDASTTILANDVCGKRLTSCKLRFGEFSVLPFGGFPAVALIR